MNRVHNSENQKVFKVKLDGENYLSQGLIEAIIAIAIVAIASLVFLDIASNSIVTVDTIVKTDQLIKVSTETGQKVRKIAELQNNNKEANVTLFPNPNTSVGQCFEIGGDFQNPVFTNNANSVCTVSTLDTCRERVTSSDNVFSVYCITQAPQGSLVVGTVYTGLKECKKGESGNCTIADSKYTVAVYIESSSRASCNFNNICEAANNENASNCLDCNSAFLFTCNNNGTCEVNESIGSCPNDCKIIMNSCNNNRICEAARGETSANCADCAPKSICGDGKCNFKNGETDATCIADCHCGNRVCESAYGETTATCNTDCAVIPPTQTCQSVCTEYDRIRRVCNRTEQVCTPP